jgi:predicted nuclease of predicted toxin-antitoxin system
VNQSAPKLLLDEHIWEDLAAVLGSQGYDVVHLNHTEHRGMDDEPLLALAAAQSRAVLTYNHRDFVPLARAWFEADREHAGIILSIQLPPGELLRQTRRLLQSLTADELANMVRWLQEFS